MGSEFYSGYSQIVFKLNLPTRVSPEISSSGLVTPGLGNVVYLVDLQIPNLSVHRSPKGDAKMLFPGLPPETQIQWGLQ